MVRKSALGRSRAASARVLSTRALTGVTLYEPEELVLSARAGTPLREIEALLDAHGQQLAFEPMDYGPLLGVAPQGATIGGVVAVNASGPRRIKSGAARDHLLGFVASRDAASIVKSGGRVMKNVTGYRPVETRRRRLTARWRLLTEVTSRCFQGRRRKRLCSASGADECGESRHLAPRVGDALRSFLATPCSRRRVAACY